MSESLPKGIAREQKRLLALLDTYREIGPAGAFGYAQIKAILIGSFDACASGDPVLMLSALTSMRGCE